MCSDAPHRWRALADVRGRWQTTADFEPAFPRAAVSHQRALAFQNVARSASCLSYQNHGAPGSVPATPGECWYPALKLTGSDAPHRRLLSNPALCAANLAANCGQLVRSSARPSYQRGRLPGAPPPTAPTKSRRSASKRGGGCRGVRVRNLRRTSTWLEQ